MIKYRLVMYYQEQTAIRLGLSFRVDKVFQVSEEPNGFSAIKAVNFFEEAFGNIFYCKTDLLFDSAKDAKLSLEGFELQKIIKNWSEH
jgi:hypothetical protein